MIARRPRAEHARGGEDECLLCRCAVRGGVAFVRPAEGRVVVDVSRGAGRDGRGGGACRGRYARGATGSDLIATVNYHSSGGQICSALHCEAPSEALAEHLC